MTAPAPITTHQGIVRGDDYRAVDGRALIWFCPSWPNLAGATLELIVGHDEPLVYAALPTTWKSVIPATPSPVHVAHLDVLRAQTEELSEGQYDYTLRVTLADGDRVTLAIGKLSVQAEPGMAPLFPAQP